MYYAAITLTIVANVGYHLFQRSIRPDASAMGSLVVTYAVALALSVVLMVMLPGRGVSASLSSTSWPSWALGIAIVGLEVGFLLAYRAGWDLGLAAPYANVAVALALLPIGVLAFGDRLTTRKLAGFILAVIGIALLSGKPDRNGATGTAVDHDAAPEDPA